MLVWRRVEVSSNQLLLIVQCLLQNIFHLISESNQTDVAESVLVGDSVHRREETVEISMCVLPQEKCGLRLYFCLIFLFMP